MYSDTGYLTPTPPFDLAKSLDFLGMFPPMQNEQALAERSLTKAIGVGGHTLAFQVVAQGSVEEPQLAYTLFAEQPLSAAIKASAIDRIAFFLSLTDDLRPFYSVARQDPEFAPIVEQLYGYHQVKFTSPFENACWAILSQRTPMAVARKTKHALAERLGGSLSLAGTVYWAFPEPIAVAAAGDDELRALVQNERKVEYLRSAAESFADVDEGFLRTAAYDQVRAWLLRIKGIGEWSASFIMIRGLGRMERASFAEQRLLDGAAKLYGQGQPLSRDEVERIAERYGAWQGYWAHYLRAAE
jgi:DNA-3-methyladenine glycosylase II